MPDDEAGEKASVSTFNEIFANPFARRGSTCCYVAMTLTALFVMVSLLTTAGLCYFLILTEKTAEKEVFKTDDARKLLFANFESKYKKVYSEKDRTERINTFIDNLNYVETLNFEAGGRTTYGVNQFSDLSWNEFKKEMLMLEDGAKNKKPAAKYDGKIDDIVDWRTKNVLSDIKEQRNCASGWAFSVVDVLEAKLAIQELGRRNFSAQQLIDCVGSCSQAVLFDAYTEVAKYGLPAASENKYRAVKDRCQRKESSKLWPLELNVSPVATNEVLMAHSIKDGGPNSIVLKVGRSLQFYQSGIANHNDCNADTENWHVVTLVGFGRTEAGDDFWIGKNHWGVDWGEKGYFQATRGSNWCALTTQPLGVWYGTSDQ